ncbi:hypothetical protein GBF35_46175 [Nonomuraea phyllanthi]|uniref:hypothetical protein n=1 Tax=Nonomuraea phyllanthi TaxID=2219224 RepID=UPI00129338DC|nr:hypothetical protein [Nonomuraea phyllanthi]QFY12970.1 hypothetical protein GBF35_46175 [Nonomuraea phyllanthi]
MIGIGNLLLRWVSELGGGKVADLRSRILRTARGRGLELREGAEVRWIRKVSTLGHLDVDWRRGIWSIAPPVLTRLPFSDGVALITGFRTAACERAVITAAEEWAVVLRTQNEVVDGDIPVPDSLLVQYDSPEDLPTRASSLGFFFTPCAAMQIFDLLPDLQPGPAAAPPAPGNADTVQRYNFAARSYEPAHSYSTDGLYRWRGADWSRLIQVRRGAQWLSTEHEYGVYLELARLGQSVLRWRPEAVPGRERVGSLFTDRGAPLPPLHARAAVLCTGLQPRFSQLAETISYDNVPKPAAERLARSLQQDLEVLPASAPFGKAT